MNVNYAIVFVGDMARAVGFYRDVIGLPLKFETSHWSEFVTGGATLALHLAEGTGSGPDDARHMPAGRCRPGFAVSDLDAFHGRMVAAGVPCTQEPKETFGTRIAQYVDPDGLGISVSEERAARG